MVMFKFGSASDGDGECLFQQGEPLRNEAFDKKYVRILSSKGADIMAYLTQDADLNVFSVGDSIELVKSVSLKEQGAYDVTIVGETFFVTDNAGSAYTMKLPDMAVEPMEGVKTEYGNKATRIAVDETGSKMALGDEKGYLTVFENGAKIAYWAVGKKPLISVGFTDDGLYAFALGLDRQMTLGDLTDKKTMRKVIAPSDYAQPTSCALLGERQIAVGGDDGAIRVWKY